MVVEIDPVVSNCVAWAWWDPRQAWLVPGSQASWTEQPGNTGNTANMECIGMPNEAFSDMEGLFTIFNR